MSEWITGPVNRCAQVLPEKKLLKPQMDTDGHRSEGVTKRPGITHSLTRLTDSLSASLRGDQDEEQGSRARNSDFAPRWRLRAGSYFLLFPPHPCLSVKSVSKDFSFRSALEATRRKLLSQ